MTLIAGNTTAGGGGSALVESVDVGDDELDCVLGEDDVVAVVDELAVGVVAVVDVEATVEVVVGVVLAVELDVLVVELDELVVDGSAVEPPSTVIRSAAPVSGTAAPTVVAVPGSSATTETAARSATGSRSKPVQAVGINAPTETAKAGPHHRLNLLVRITRRLPI